MMEENNIKGSKRGYLEEDFMFFHIKDKKEMEFDYHYHEFDKILVFISGKVTYFIEGKAYRLKPWDILLVGSQEVHRPVIDSTEYYDRIVVWARPGFIEEHNNGDCNLNTCFELAEKEKYNLLRLAPEAMVNLRYTLNMLEEACKNAGFGQKVLKNALFMQFIVHLNRLFLNTNKDKSLGDIEYDERIEALLSYIGKNLERDLSIDKLSEKLFLSRYYLMHKFKSQTGYTIHSYILQKRLIKAASLLTQGRPVLEASLESGFEDYSSFIRAFKKMYGVPPSKYAGSGRPAPGVDVF